ncbi:MAG: P-loop NTPase [Spirochaetales bacterium]|nr:P-loop NTPase [Spirochaetales bacterium]
MMIIPVASGKGGVGKSLLAANLGISLGEAGKKVILVDLDLGASNLHMFLGLRSVKQGIGTFLNSHHKDFNSILVKTDYEGVSLIPGDAEIPDIAQLKTAQKRLLMRELCGLDADFLIMDLGPGTNYDVLDFFLVSQRGILVTTPALTSILNAYLFFKNAVFRIMSSTFKSKSKAALYIEKLKKDGTPLQKIYVVKLLQKIKEIDIDCYNDFTIKIRNFKPFFVLNMLVNKKDTDKANQLRRSVKEYLDIDIEHLGIISKDAAQDIALNSRLPIVKYKPDSILSQAIYRIADKLLQCESEGEGPLDLENIEESYQIAEMEAEADFQAKLHYMEELLHCGELSKGDLIEIIKSQHYEIEKLKKESNLLKAKLIRAIDEGFVY